MAPPRDARLPRDRSPWLPGNRVPWRRVYTGPEVIHGLPWDDLRTILLAPEFFACHPNVVLGTSNSPFLGFAAVCGIIFGLGALVNWCSEATNKETRGEALGKAFSLVLAIAIPVGFMYLLMKLFMAK